MKHVIQFSEEVLALNSKKTRRKRSGLQMNVGG